MEKVLQGILVFVVSYAAGSVVVYVLRKVLMHYVNKGIEADYANDDDDDDDLMYA